MKRTIRKTGRGNGLFNEAGVTAVEFALVVPVFLILFLGIIEYGWIMTQQLMLSHAVTEGARAGLRLPPVSEPGLIAAEARDRVKAVFKPVGIIEDDAVEVFIRGQEGSPADPPLPKRIFVRVPGWPYTPLVGYLPKAMVPETLKSSATFAFP